MVSGTGYKVNVTDDMKTTWGETDAVVMTIERSRSDAPDVCGTLTPTESEASGAPAGPRPAAEADEASCRRQIVIVKRSLVIRAAQS